MHSDNKHAPTSTVHVQIVMALTQVLKLKATTNIKECVVDFVFVYCVCVGFYDYYIHQSFPFIIIIITYIQV